MSSNSIAFLFARSKRDFAAVALLGAAIVLVGCDLGTYGRRYSERGEQLRTDTEMSTLLGEALPLSVKDMSGRDAGAMIRVPAAISSDHVVYEAEMASSFPKRAMPPGIALPGLTAAREQMVTMLDGSRIGTYFYVGAVGNDQVDSLDALKENIATLVNAVFTTANARFELLEYPAIGGDVSSWHVIQLIATQEFIYAPPNSQIQDQYRSTSGHLLIGIYPTQTHYVIVGARSPAEVEDAIQLISGTAAAMGSIRASEAEGT